MSKSLLQKSEYSQQRHERLAAQASPYLLALRVDDACNALGIGRTMLYELVAAGRLKSFQIGGRRLFAKSELEAFVSREAANAG
jgi:excisionase family DNA binding protein